MATFLSKLFKPKWQSKHTATRLEAIKELDPNSNDGHQILVDLAENDQQAAVRKSAISRIVEPQALIQLHNKTQDDFKQVIEDKLYDIANNQSLSIFDLITDTRLLTEMIIKSNQADAFLTGLARIEDSSSLLVIASQAKMSKLRQAAAELIEREADLSSLLTLAKGKDKSVYHIAKSKLSTIRNQVAEKQQQQEELEKTLSDIEALANTEAMQHFSAKLNNLSTRWSNISFAADHTQAKRFEQLQSECQARIEQLEQEKVAQEEQERLIQTGGDEQEATLFTLSETLKRFTTEAPSFLDISAIDALTKTQENRWLEVTRQVKVDKHRAKHYQVMMSELKAYLKSLSTLKELDAELLALVSELDKLGKKDVSRIEALSQEINKHLRKVNWPKDYAIPASIIKAREAQGHSADIKKQLAENSKEVDQKIEQLIPQLDKALEDKQLKKSSTLLKDIQRQLSKLTSKQSEKYHNQLNLRINQLNDLRDWQGYASNPRQQELCEAMERLADAHIEPRDKADRIKAMQKEWKSLGGAADQKIWERFKAAADKAYEPCHAFFDEQNQLKQNNTKKREQILTELNNYLEQNDWSTTDWKASEKINRQARQEWKEAYPVDFKANKPLQQSFNTLLAKFDEKLDGERNKNLGLKEAIIEQAQPLVALEDLAQAIQGAKDLQQAWQKIGITPYKKERALWAQFRGICDEIFARRDQIRNEQKAEASKALDAADTLLTEMETELASLDTQDSEALQPKLAEYRKAFKGLSGLNGRALEKTQKRFDAVVKQLKQHISAHENLKHLQAWQEIQRKATLCRELYAGNTTSSAALDEAFNSQSELPKHMEDSLKSLWISVKAGSISKDKVISLDDARSLCIACEIAAGIDSPEADKELRMQMQVSRLSEGMSSSSEHQTREQQLNASLSKWYDTVGLSTEEFSGLEERVQNTIKHLFSSED